MLGDTIASALSAVGITEARVHQWFGDCCCRERRDKLNMLDAWVRQSLKVGRERAVILLEKLIKP